MSLEPNDKIDLALSSSDGIDREGSPLKTIVFRTTLGTEYPFPDMLGDHITGVIHQLDLRSEQIILRNISSATLILPYRVLSEMLVDDRTTWKR